MKTCCMCAGLLPLDAFNRDSSRADGLSSRCRACSRTDKRARYARRPEPTLEARRSYVESNHTALAEKRRQGVEALSDSYVKKRLLDRTSLKTADLSPELISLKREEMCLRRLGKRMLQASQKEAEA